MTCLMLFLLAATPGIIALVDDWFRHRAWLRRERAANAAFGAWVDARAEDAARRQALAGKAKT